MTIRKRNGFFSSQFQEQGVDYFFTFNGKFSKKYKRQMPVFQKAKDARDEEAELRRQIRTGEFYTEPGLEDFCTFVDNVYLPYANEYKASAKSDETFCKILKNYFKDKKFSDIMPMLVEKFIKERLESTTQRKETLPDGTTRQRQISPVTVNKQFKCLSMICKMAIQEGRSGISINPCQNIRQSVRKRLAKRNKRERFLTYEEEKRLIDQLTGIREHLKPLVILAIETAMRRGELLRLKWELVNLSQESKSYIAGDDEITIHAKSIFLPKEITKTDKPREIPLSERAVAILQELFDSELRGEFVLQNNRTQMRLTEIKRGFKSACADAGIPHGIYKPNGLTFHDLRHTWATRAADAGVSPFVIRDILGHTTVRMSNDYTHSTQLARQNAMVAIGSALPMKTKEESGKILAIA